MHIDVYVYYIYNNKKKHTGVGIRRFVLCVMLWNNIRIRTRRICLRSRDKAGMKASSFLKIGVFHFQGMYIHINIFFIISSYMSCDWWRIYPFISLTPIFKKLDAFIPALSLLAHSLFLPLFFMMFHIIKRQE